MTTAQDQQSRAVIAAWNAQADEHNQWETLGDDEKIDWAMKAARALPASMKPVAQVLSSRSGNDTSTVDKAFPAGTKLYAAAHALPASMKPVAEIFAGDLFRVNQGPDAEPVTGDHDLYTAAQVQTMLAHRGHGEGANQPQTRMDAGSHRGRGLPSGWQPVPVEPTEEQLAALRQKPHPANPNGWDVNHRRIYREMLAAAPQLPAAQEHAYTFAPEWVLASKYEEMTGVTRETVKQRKKNGTWKLGQQVAVVSRRLDVNIKAADQWINDKNSTHRPA